VGCLSVRTAESIAALNFLDGNSGGSVVEMEIIHETIHEIALFKKNYDLTSREIALTLLITSHFRQRSSSRNGPTKSS
jgi:hypothetical protein